MNFFIEVFYLTILGIVSFIAFVLILDTRFIKRLFLPKKHYMLYHIFLVLFAGFCLQHTYMSIKLSDIKDNFNAVAQQGPTRVFVNDYMSRSADYLGSLDNIINKRNIVLKNHGYKIIGSWYMQSHSRNGHQDISVDTNALYVWIPFS